MKCRFERLEDRKLLAVDLGQISGTVLNDLQNDGNPANDTAVVGLPVTLYRDGNSNGTFDGAGTDPQYGSATVTDASGDYTFTGLIEGTYFVEISPTADLQVLAGGDMQTVTFNSAEAMGVTALTIDDFATAQTATVMRTGGAMGVTDASDADAANANDGGVRDLYVNATTTGNVTLTSMFGGGNLLSLESSSGTEGLARVTWDGADGDGDAVDPTGLSLDFSDSGSNFGMLLRVSADAKPAAEVTMRLTSGSGNTAEATVSILDQDGLLDGDADEEIVVPFTAFTENVQGTGVDFSNVTAIEMILDFQDPSVSGLDARVEMVGVVGNTVKTADFTALYRMSLGDQVFADLDNDGVLDLGETGIEDVVVSLYEDTNTDGVYSDGVDTFIGNDTTDASGNFLFEDLLPGDYILRIAETEFAASEPLDGLISSTGNETATVAPDPDDDTNDDDNGYALSTFGVVTQAVTLVGDAEPTDDGDSDANTNLSVDFGFYGFDLVIDKEVDLSAVSTGGALVYTIDVTNNGPSTALGVSFSDTLPAGVTFDSGSTTVGAVAHAAGVVTANLGNIASGDTVTVTINVDVDGGATGTLTNTATVSAANEDDTSNNTATAMTSVDETIDLAVTKVDDDGDADVAPGDTIVYTVTVRNNGPSTATNVVLTDNLPANLTFNTGASTPTPDSVVGGPSTGTTLTYNLGTLASGASTDITISATVSSTFVGTLTNTASATADETETTTANNSATSQSLVAVSPSSIAGSVYVDSNNNGVRDAGEQGIANVTVTLTGTDFTTAAVNQVTTTAADGTYQFANLLPGTYQLTESHPAFFPDGQDALGSEGGVLANDDLSNIVLGSGVNATAYNFGELPPTLSKRRFLASSVTPAGTGSVDFDIITTAGVGASATGVGFTAITADTGQGTATLGLTSQATGDFTIGTELVTVAALASGSFDGAAGNGAITQINVDVDQASATAGNDVTVDRTGTALTLTFDADAIVVDDVINAINNNGSTGNVGTINYSGTIAAGDFTSSTAGGGASAIAADELAITPDSALAGGGAETLTLVAIEDSDADGAEISAGNAPTIAFTGNAAADSADYDAATNQLNVNINSGDTSNRTFQDLADLIAASGEFTVNGATSSPSLTNGAFLLGSTAATVDTNTGALTVTVDGTDATTTAVTIDIQALASEGTDGQIDIDFVEAALGSGSPEVVIIGDAASGYTVQLNRDHAGGVSIEEIETALETIAEIDSVTITASAGATFNVHDVAAINELPNSTVSLTGGVDEVVTTETIVLLAATGLTGGIDIDFSEVNLSGTGTNVVDNGSVGGNESYTLQIDSTVGVPIDSIRSALASITEIDSASFTSVSPGTSTYNAAADAPPSAVSIVGAG
ncbi:beta strand repeat-containing protein [Aeoliella sp.]|uniref:beta strand repeat-containing protein n=1 Tax=Aeoliella sp. TaxID=2795800 RepID=UPI003CCBD06A